MSLEAAQKTLLATAADTAIVNFISSRTANPWTEWLPSTHRLIAGVRTKNHPGFSQPANPLEIAGYLAVAGTTHCANGWAFFGRALNALMAGDAHSAWHFAYYAELRAALSLLANSGVGVFNEWNCVVNNGSVVTPLEQRVGGNRLNPRPLGTHKMAWLALEELLVSNVSFQSKISRAVTLFGTDIGSFVQSAFPGVGASLPLSAWVRKWTFDLSQCAEDRNLRNRASYQPHELWNLSASAGATAAYVHELWGLLEPTPASPFHAFDKYLYRLALEAGAELDPGFQQSDPYALIPAAVSRLDPGVVEQLGEDFLLRKGAWQNDPDVVKYSRHQLPIPVSPFPAISRSLMLLRLATGVTRSNLANAGLPLPSGLAFWADTMGVDRGLWDVNDGPADLMDLWSDIDVELQDLGAIMANGGPDTYRRWSSDLPGNQLTLATTERAALWAIAR